MKQLIVFLFIGIGWGVNGQSAHYNTKKGFAAEGYDVVAYFNGSAKEGSKTYVTTNDNVKYTFSNQQNLEAFLKDPDRYKPQYGGYCAYAMAFSGKKVSINPETFEIRDGKLYLFYNSGRNNTLDSWKKESPNALIVQADKNWIKINKN